MLQNASDSRMVSRLTQKMVEVIQEDITNPRGQRNVIDGEAELLEDFPQLSHDDVLACLAYAADRERCLITLSSSAA